MYNPSNYGLGDKGAGIVALLQTRDLLRAEAIRLVLGDDSHPILELKIGCPLLSTQASRSGRKYCGLCHPMDNVFGSVAILNALWATRIYEGPVTIIVNQLMAYLSPDQREFLLYSLREVVDFYRGSVILVTDVIVRSDWTANDDPTLSAQEAREMFQQMGKDQRVDLWERAFENEGEALDTISDRPDFRHYWIGNHEIDKALARIQEEEKRQRERLRMRCYTLDLNF